MKYVLAVVIFIVALVIINFKFYPFIFRIKNTNYFFCHIPKTGGTSFSLTYVNNPFNNIPWHIKIGNYPIRIQRQFIAVVRNPYDRLVSCFEYFKKEGIYYSNLINLYKKTGLSSKKWVYNNKINDFTLFVKKVVNNDLIDVCFYPQTNFIKSTKNKIHCKVIKYENLINDLEKVLNINIYLPKINESRKVKEWKKYYNKETAYLVYHFYKSDFINFNYAYFKY